MKKPPQNPEFERFTEAMRQVLTVSKAELQRRIEEDRASRKPAPGKGRKTRTAKLSGK